MSRDKPIDVMVICWKVIGVSLAIIATVIIFEIWRIG